MIPEGFAPDRSKSVAMLNLTQTRYDLPTTLAYKVRAITYEDSAGELFRKYNHVYLLLKLIQTNETEIRRLNEAKTAGRDKLIKLQITEETYKAFLDNYFGVPPVVEYRYGNSEDDEPNNTVRHTLGILHLKPTHHKVDDDKAIVRVGGWRVISVSCDKFGCDGCKVKDAMKPVDYCTNSCKVEGREKDILPDTNDITLVDAIKHTELLIDVRKKIDEPTFTLLGKVHMFLDSQKTELPGVVGDIGHSEKLAAKKGELDGFEEVL